MTLKSPFATKIERGGYTAIVHKDGDTYIAEDEQGIEVIANTDASTVIQKAIDDYAAYGLVLVKPNVTISTSLKVLDATSRLEFLGKMTLATGINGIEIGDPTHDASGLELKLGSIDGVDELSHGIILKRTSVSRIFFRVIENCSIGMYFNPCTSGFAYQNQIEGAIISGCGTAGVRFSSSVLTMEGNIITTSVFNSLIGVDLVSGGFSTHNKFFGTIDCMDRANSEDIKDAVGKQLFILDYLRPETCTIADDTIIINAKGVDHGGSVFDVQKGSVNAQNVDFAPLLLWDFYRDSTGDWTKYHCTLGTPAKSITRITATGTDAQIYRDVVVDGGEAQTIVIRYKLISGTTEEGKIYYKTGSHGYSESYWKKMIDWIGDGGWHIQVLDMSDLNSGGTDWIDNTITGLKFTFFVGASTSVLDIDYIAVGGRGYASIYSMDDALETPATAGAAGNKGDMRWDASYIYLCTAKDTWKRVAIATW